MHKAKQFSIFLLIVITMLLFHGVEGNFRDLRKSFVAFVSGKKAAAWQDLWTANSGAEVLPENARIMIELLRSVNASDYRYSKKIAKDPQRLVEGIFPMRHNKTSPYFLFFAEEPMPVSCRILAKQKGVMLAFCS